MAETILEEHSRLQLPRRAYTLVLAGGRGSRLHELTDNRAKPAVYFGGKFRIIDFVLSNCINSGLRRIGVLTQYKSHSLLRHLQRGWSFLRPEANEFMDLLPAQQRIDEVSWYSGTADAVYQNLDIIRANGPEFVVVLAGDHIYKMDYSRMLASHVETGAECTVGCIEVPLEEARGFGVMHVDENLRIVDFIEKSPTPPSMPGKPDRALASMGIYVFNAAYLYDRLAQDAAKPGSTHDFGKDLIPDIVAKGEAVAHPFALSCVSEGDAESYWRDAGTPTGPRTSTSARSRPNSTCIRRTGRSSRTRNSCRRPSSSSTTTPAAAWRSIRWCPAAASSPAPRCGARCSSRAAASIHGRN
jgi:glucose-1-phosphate adenylyltransferase